MIEGIVNHTALQAPLERVWNAITDSAKFGVWFGAEWDGPFVAGALTTGRIVPTTVDADIASALGSDIGDAARDQNEGGWEAQARLIARYLDLAE